jgi:hypothetical protein
MYQGSTESAFSSASAKPIELLQRLDEPLLTVDEGAHHGGSGEASRN